MGNCKDCKFWGYYRAGHCDRVDSNYSDIKFDIWVTVMDDSGLSTGLVTGPDFGCVLFEPKRKTK